MISVTHSSMTRLHQWICSPVVRKVSLFIEKSGSDRSRCRLIVLQSLSVIKHAVILPQARGCLEGWAAK